MNKSEILQILRAHKDEFAKNYGVTVIGLFGSYAKSREVKNSDIDIFAEMPPKFDLLVHFQVELEILLKRKIDLVRLREKMNPRLRENILRDGLYA